MAEIHVGNAPCSWGTLEFEGLEGEQIGYARMLDELAETGYTGTELGDWGYMPTDPTRLASELAKRNLVMLGAFVPVALAKEAAHGPGEAEAIKTARLLAAVATEPWPYLILADENGSVPERTRNAGRITPELGLDDEAWKVFARGAERIARAVLEETGLRTLFHHHGAGYVETPDEIARLLALTDPALLGLVYDTGHYVFGAGGGSDALEGLDRYAERIRYVHFKDCHPEIAAQAKAESLDYFEVVRRGVFCELGQGCVDFPAALGRLRDRGYEGYVLVEQDVLPGMGAPKESARRNREYLYSIGV